MKFEASGALELLFAPLHLLYLKKITIFKLNMKFHDVFECFRKFLGLTRRSQAAP